MVAEAQIDRFGRSWPACPQHVRIYLHDHPRVGSRTWACSTPTCMHVTGGRTPIHLDRAPKSNNGLIPRKYITSVMHTDDVYPRRFRSKKAYYLPSSQNKSKVDMCTGSSSHLIHLFMLHASLLFHACVYPQNSKGLLSTLLFLYKKRPPLLDSVIDWVEVFYLKASAKQQLAAWLQMPCAKKANICRQNALCVPRHSRHQIRKGTKKKEKIRKSSK